MFAARLSLTVLFVVTLLNCAAISIDGIIKDETGGAPVTANTVAAGSSGDAFDRIISGEEEIAPLRGEALVERFDKRLRRIGGWFRSESTELISIGIVTAVLVAFGVAAGWLLRYLRKKQVKSRSRIGIRLFFALAGPLLTLLIVSIVFGMLLPVMRTTPIYTAVVRIFFTTVTLLTAAMGMRLVSAFSDRMIIYARRDDNNLDVLMVDIARKVVKILVAAVAVLFIGQTIFDLNITTLLAGAGVVGLAVAFASRETLANFFGTLVIILDAPFRCGDRIEVTGVDGIVEEVGMRSTRIRTRNESLVVIPNRQIAEANVENISRRGTFRFMFTVGMVYQSTPEQMALTMKTLHEIVDNFHGQDDSEFAPRIFFDSFGDSGMNITVIMWLKTGSFAEEEQMRTEINSEILRRFDAAGLAMAYNTVTNIVTGDPAQPLVFTAAAPEKQA